MKLKSFDFLPIYSSAFLREYEGMLEALWNMAPRDGLEPPTQ